MTAWVDVTCLCGDQTEVLHLDARLPVPVRPCSCNTCRHTTGVLYLSCLPLRSPPRLVGRLTRYDSSDKLSRYFCPRCGSHMFIHVSRHDAWKVCSGVVDALGHGHEHEHEHAEQVARSGLEKMVHHEFVGDTIDGGLACCLTDFDDHAAPLLSQGPDGPRWSRPWPTASKSPALEADGTQALTPPRQRLKAACHCGGVAFGVTRPDAASSECSSPWPDLLVPYRESSPANPGDAKWWLRDRGRKYLAGTCACRSCRLAAGVPVQTWAFIPRVNITHLDGQPWVGRMGTLTRIESSPGCFREFCRRCGATVFWHARDRPHLIDVSVGLFRADEGARAEAWLEWWTDRVSFAEDAFDPPFVHHLQRGLKNVAANT